jgi:hypothetical protein
MDIRYTRCAKTTAKTVIVLITGLLILIFLAGCSQNYGRIQWDENVTRAFENNRVEPDYKFYQYAVGMRVFAIIGLNPELELRSKVWRELSSDTEDFSLATSRIWYNYTELPEDPRGAIIRNPAGEDVGVYFSSIRFVSIKFQPNNRVMVMLDTTPITGGPDNYRIR